MTSFAEKCFDIFARTTADYHIADDIDAPFANPYEKGSIEHTLAAKNHIDAVQWHLEDIIRDENIDPVEALALKRRIDRSNQERTDMVEDIDTYFREKYAAVKPLPSARLNTESPAWALDRLSILALKIYHMRAEADRDNADDAHRAKCRAKLSVLLEQRADLTQAIDYLLDDIAAGRIYMKVYRQMKMYNDPDTNPVLYSSKK
ncbi:MAG: DUF4254 domain-containing protein [Muribaculaceae bacterium]|nr:DUF4254 domain-containing protein [Muribaculaceae bacterium]MBQ7211212.1 DUF4254 domain-containing protein [Muribaculaceae bacterium]